MFEKFTIKSGAALAIAVLVTAGCGGGGDAGDSTGDAATASSGAAASPVDASTAGHISGTINFSGMPPEGEAIDMSEEPVCAAKHASTPMLQSVVVGDGGGLANVFVYVKEGLDGLEFPTPTGAVLDQNGCVYSPHVMGIQVGQDLIIRNSDGLLHNIKASPTENRPFNTSQPVNMETTRTFATAEVMVPVQCDVHGWMTAYVAVLDHPYHSVSSDGGAFSLETLPPGNYVIEAWHESFGTVTQTVTVTTGETTEITFEFDETMAGNFVPLADPLIVRHDQRITAVGAEDRF